MSALALAAAGVGVSVVYQVQHDNDPIPVLVVGSIWVGVVVGVASVNPDLGNALAAVFFLGMFLSRGDGIINFVSDLTTSNAPPKTHPKRKATRP